MGLITAAVATVHLVTHRSMTSCLAVSLPHAAPELFDLLFKMLLFRFIYI